MKAKAIATQAIPDGAEVRYKACGNVREIMYMENRNRKCVLLKLDKDTYCDLRTGEVKEFQHQDTRADDSISIRKTMTRLRDLLNTNITDVLNCRWVTLTYAENQRDSKKAYRDWEVFNKRFKRKYPGYEYISVIEPQGRGAWHFHVVFIWKTKAPYIPNEILREIWGHGFVTIKRLDDVDNVGAYLTAYLCDMDVEEAKTAGMIWTSEAEMKEVEVQDENGNKISKKILKGARLCYYPRGMNIYRCSRGVKPPEIEWTTAKRAKEKVSGATLTFETAVQITDEENGYQNTIQHLYYNTKRQKDNTD